MIEIKCHHNVGKNKHFQIDSGWYYSPIIDGKEYSFIAETEDMALIVGLAIKYDGINSQFPKMAARMLKIDTEWVN